MAGMYLILTECKTQVEKINLIIKARTEYEKVKKKSLCSIKDSVKDIEKPLYTPLLRAKVALEIVELFSLSDYSQINSENNN